MRDLVVDLARTGLLPCRSLASTRINAAIRHPPDFNVERAAELTNAAAPDCLADFETLEAKLALLPDSPTSKRAKTTMVAPACGVLFVMVRLSYQVGKTAEATMTKSELEALLIELVCLLQEMSGREKVSVDANTKPVLDVPGFDSLNGIEITVEVMDRFKLELDFNNVLIDDDRALTIAQATERLAICLQASVHG